MKPYFKDSRVNDEGMKIRRKGAISEFSSKSEYAPTSEEEVNGEKMYQHQTWKLEKVECVEIFEWMVTATKYPQMSEIQHLVVPPILILMDDFDPIYKERGIRLLQHALVRQSLISDVRKTGLGDVFFQVGCSPIYISHLNLSKNILRHFV